jgi:cytosine/adenosine deaminase-related metal-dependent hydrolase
MGDVLVRDGRVAAIERNLSLEEADVIDARGAIVMPGFVDSHRHLWEGVIRNALPDATLVDYLVEVNGRLGTVYRPQDAYIGTLISALGALNAGVTSILDWSHIQNTPAHTEAVIAALTESGIRAVFAYGPPSNGKGPWWLQHGHEYPQAVRQLRSSHFNSQDQRLTLAVAAAGPEIAPVEFAAQEWRVARDIGARIAVHVGTGPMGRLGKLEAFGRTETLGPDTTYIHCSGLNAHEWQMIADTGGSVSLSGAIEMQMGHGSPPVQAALDYGLAPSLSVDVECSQPGDMFGQMRMAFALQRMTAHELTLAGKTAPRLMTTRDVLSWATINGAVANGLASQVGRLSPGMQADVIILRADCINVMPLNNAYGAIVLAMDTSNVDTVIVGGQMLKRGGQLLGIDMQRIKRELNSSRDHVMTTAGYELSPTAATICNKHTYASLARPK